MQIMGNEKRTRNRGGGARSRSPGLHLHTNAGRAWGPIYPLRACGLPRRVRQVRCVSSKIVFLLYDVLS
jgi:hypothetical protein